MTDQQINIQVQDSVAPSIAPKIQSIGDAARATDAALIQLKAQLDSLNGGAIAQLALAQQRLTQSTTAQINAQATLLKAQAQANLQNQQAAAQYLANEAALSKLTATEVAAATAADKLAAAQAKAIASAKAAQAAQSAQNDFNSLLGVKAPGDFKGDARASAAVFATSIQQAEALAKAEADATAEAQKLLNAQKAINDAAKAKQDASQAQSDFNSLLGIDQATKSAKDSASVFQEAANAEQDLVNRTNALKAALDPAFVAQQRMNTQLSEANALFKAGKISESELANLTNAARNSFEQFGVSLGHTSHASAGVTRELVVMGREIANGNFTKLAGSSTILVQRLGLLEAILSPVGLAFLAVGAAAVGFGISVADAQNEIAKINNSLTLTGNFAGLTASDFEDMAKSIGDSTKKSTHSVEEIELAFVQSGKYSAEQINNLTKSVIDLSKFTGQSTEQITKQFLTIAEGPEKFAQAFGHFDVAQLSLIHSLVEQGDVTRATDEVTKDLIQFLESKGTPQVGFFAQKWQELTKAVSDFFYGIGTAQSDTLENQLVTLQKKAADLRGEISSLGSVWNEIRSGAFLGGGNQGFFDELSDTEKQIAAVQKQIELQKQQAAQQREIEKQRQDDDRYFKTLTDDIGRYGGSMNTATNEIKQFETALAALKKDRPTDPYVQSADANKSRIEEGIRKKYDRGDVNYANEVSKENQALNAQLSLLGLIGEDREKQQQLNSIQSAFEGKHLAINQADLAVFKQKIDAIAAAAKEQAALTTVYNETQSAQQAFNLTQQAAEKLLRAGLINWQQYDDVVAKATLSLQRANDPLYDFNKSLDDQAALVGLVGDKLEVETRVQALFNQLTEQGHANAQELAESERARIQQSIEAQRVDSAFKKIYDENTGAAKGFAAQLQALQRAEKTGEISATQYRNSLVHVDAEMRQLKLDSGKGNFTDAMTQSFHKLIENYKSGLSGLSDVFGNFFDQIDTGFADSIGNAIAHGDDLKSSLKAAAQDGIGSLISGLIKLGVQQVINYTLGQTLQTQATASAVTSQGEILTAALPAATATSVSSYGVAALEGLAALVAVFAIAKGLGAFESGGYTGNGATDQVAGVVHGREFVVNAAGTARNRQWLEAMNNGATMMASNSHSYSGYPHAGSGVAVEINNYGTSKKFDVQQVDEGRIRIIAKDEADKSVRKNAPDVIASAIKNPNSQVSKSLNNNTQTQRKR